MACRRCSPKMISDPTPSSTLSSGVNSWPFTTVPFVLLRSVAYTLSSSAGAHAGARRGVWAGPPRASPTKNGCHISKPTLSTAPPCALRCAAPAPAPRRPPHGPDAHAHQNSIGHSPTRRRAWRLLTVGIASWMSAGTLRPTSYTPGCSSMGPGMGTCGAAGHLGRVSEGARTGRWGGGAATGAVAPRTEPMARVRPRGGGGGGAAAGHLLSNVLRRPAPRGREEQAAGREDHVTVADLPGDASGATCVSGPRTCEGASQVVDAACEAIAAGALSEQAAPTKPQLSQQCTVVDRRGRRVKPHRACRRASGEISDPGSVPLLHCMHASRLSAPWPVVARCLWRSYLDL